MAQIFLSYSHSDSDFVKLIEPRIARIFGEGLLWYDRSPNGLQAGNIWWDEILRQIHSCQIFLFLISDESAVSKSCTKELEEAVNLNKILIPVLLESYSSNDYPETFSQEILDRLEEIQYVDLRNKSNRVKYDDLSELWGAINRSRRPALSPVERWLLYNQYEMIKLVQNDNEIKQQIETDFQRVLSHGYELAIERLMYMFQAGVSFNDCKEVEDILTMFHDIELARRNYWKTGTGFEFDEKDFWLFQFQGFDGSHEVEQMQYARFLIGDYGYFGTVAPKHNDFNSGHPLLPRYRRMLRAYRKSEDKLRLTTDDLRRIHSAAKRMDD